MYKLFIALLRIVWALDVLDFPCMEFLDTTYPINFLAWILIFMLLPPTGTTIKRITNKESE